MNRLWALRASVAILTIFTVASGWGQTLARPGWAGSGLTANVWWKHAFVYAVDAGSVDGLKGVAIKMDGLRDLGVDAVLLRGLQMGAGGAADPAAGTMEDFDVVLMQGSQHNLRVLVELAPKTPDEDVSGAARFWLSRGVAGIRLKGGSAEEMRQLRALEKGYVGERVVIGDVAQSPVAAEAPTAPVGASPTPQRGRRSRQQTPTATVRVGDGPQLVLDASITVAPLDVTAIRTALEKNDAMNRTGGPVPMLATTDAAAADSQGSASFGKIVATLLLSSRGGTMIRAGQEGVGAGAEAQSLAAWYRQVSGMAHGNATVRGGANTVLNHDADGVVAWMRRPQIVSYRSPAVVFLCNMTAQPVTLSLRPDVQALKLKGSFLRTIMRSDTGMGPMSLDTVKLAPYGVYIGEILY